MVKALPANAGDVVKSLGVENSIDGEWQPTPVFLPGEFCGQRSLAGCGSCGCKESVTIFTYVVLGFIRTLEMI